MLCLKFVFNISQNCTWREHCGEAMCGMTDPAFQAAGKEQSSTEWVSMEMAQGKRNEATSQQEGISEELPWRNDSSAYTQL